jgi:hypothetical protein
MSLEGWSRRRSALVTAWFGSVEHTDGVAERPFQEAGNRDESPNLPKEEPSPE